MKIGNTPVGAEHPCLIVAEVGLAHEGSIGQAHAFIDAVAAAGAGAVKFQCHDGQEDRPWRVRPARSPDVTRADYWKRTGFTAEEWAGLELTAGGLGLEFLCSPFSVLAVDTLAPYVGAWKIAAGEVTNYDMLGAAGRTGKPGIISMGLGTPEEIHDASEFFEEYALLISTPLYPTPPEAVGLERLEGLQDTPAAAIGISDHSGTIYPALGAATLGCDIIEVHVTFSRAMYGPDVAASVTMEELRQLVEGVRFLEAAAGPMSRESREAVERMRGVYMGATT